MGEPHAGVVFVRGERYQARCSCGWTAPELPSEYAAQLAGMLHYEETDRQRAAADGGGEG